MKRIFDICLALIGILISFPLFGAIALIIWFEDKFPIFYLQVRLGKDGNIFKNIKFRSMNKDAEKNIGAVLAEENDPRITKFGSILRATAMDELPQLWNIIKGDISWVGPRALRPEEKEVGSSVVKSVFEYPDFTERCKVRPGLTGVAQILLPRDSPRETKFKYDLWYIKHQSFWLDIYLILLSFLVTFRGKWESRQVKISSLTRKLRERVEREL